MKSTSIFIPIGILALGGLWIAIQTLEISNIENENATLKRRLKVAPLPTSSTKTSFAKKTALDSEPVNWSLVAEELKIGHGNYGAFKTSLRIEDKLRSLAAQDLKDALAAAEEESLDKTSFRILTFRFLTLLLKKDPAYLLTNPSNHPDVADIWTSKQNEAMLAWTKNSHKEALAWFDSPAPNPDQRKEFFCGIISTLVLVDFPEAKKRLTAIPEEKRFEFFDNYSSFGVKWSDGSAPPKSLPGRFAELTRLLPENRKNFIAAPLTWLGEQDRPIGISSIQRSLEGWTKRKRGTISLGVLTDYLRKIKPTPAELDLCIKAVLDSKCLHLPDQPEREPEVLRAWLRTELKPTLHTQ